MHRNRWIVLVGLVAVLGLAATAVGLAATLGETYKLTAKLDTKQEVPKPNATKGTGLFTGTLKDGKLTWRLTFSNLTGPASGGAHIHLAKVGKANPKPAIALCGPCKSGQTGTAKVSEAIEKAIESGGAYVNVHTKKNANGEIRGQIKSTEL